MFLLKSRCNRYVISVFYLFILLLVVYYLTGKPGVKKTPTVTHLLHEGSLKLLDIPYFRYLLNSDESCDNISVVFIITSYFGNVEARNFIREAFNVQRTSQLLLKKVFLLGLAPKDKYISQSAVEEESRKFKDIVQGSFVEAYRNLTYKHVMGLKWAATYCFKAQYVIKMDDDTVVNLHQLPLILNSLRPVDNERFIAGYKLRKMKPIRDPSNKWFVTFNEYQGDSYPTFLSGWFYITTPRITKELSTWANYIPYFWIDDLFVTGVLAKKLKLILFDISQFFVVNSEFMQCCLQDFNKQIACEKYVGPNGGDSSLIAKLNFKAGKCYVGGSCVKRTRPMTETCVAAKKINLGRGNPVIEKIKL